MTVSEAVPATSGSGDTHNLRVLTLAQALGASSPPIVMSLGALVGERLAPTIGLMTLPVATYTFGIAVGTLPVAAALRRAGLRPAYMALATIGLLASALSVTGILTASFLLFCLGTGITGLYGAAVQSYRFSAARSVPEERRARAISNVMLAGLAAAVIGPQIVVWTGHYHPEDPYLGGFVGQAALALIAIGVLSRLRPVPAAADGLAPQPTGAAWALLRQRRIALPVAAGVTAYVAMTLMMTAAPMAMVACGHSVGQAALGIQWHVLSMYAPSYLTGRLIERFGAGRITATGLVLLAACALVALSGETVAQFWGALVLLGLGWNLAFIGATTMLVQACRPEERNAVEGMNDFIVFGSVALTALVAGQLYAFSGWVTISAAVLVLALAAMAGATGLRPGTARG